LSTAAPKLGGKLGKKADFAALVPWEAGRQIAWAIISVSRVLQGKLFGTPVPPHLLFIRKISKLPNKQRKLWFKVMDNGLEKAYSI